MTSKIFVAIIAASIAIGVAGFLIFYVFTSQVVPQNVQPVQPGINSTSQPPAVIQSTGYNSTVTEIRGKNYDVISYPNGTHLWTGGLEEWINDSGHYVPYKISQTDTQLILENKQAPMTFNKKDCSVSIYDNDKTISQADPLVQKDWWTVYKNSGQGWQEVDLSSAQCSITTKEDKSGISVNLARTASDGKLSVMYVKKQDRPFESHVQWTNYDSSTNTFKFVEKMQNIDAEIYADNAKIDDKITYSQLSLQKIFLEKSHLAPFVIDLSSAFDNFDSLTVSREQNVASFDFGKNASELPVGGTMSLDPTFGYALGTTFGVYAPPVVGTDCAAPTIKFQNAFRIQKDASSSAIYHCYIFAVRYDVSSIPSAAVINSASLQYVLSPSTNPISCDFRQMTTDPEKDTPQALWNDILDGLSYVTNSNRCIPPDPTKLTLGIIEQLNNAVSDLQKNMPSKTFSVGISYHDMKRNGTVHATDFQNVELQATYTLNYDIKDQTSCQSLPSGSPIWDSTTKTCKVTKIFLILNKGDYLTIEPGITLQILSGTIKNFGKISNYGSLVNSGTLSLASGDTITFSGPNTYSGSFTNYGTFTNNPGSWVSLDSGTNLVISSGTFSIQTRAALDVNPSSSLTVNQNAAIDNSGVLYLASGDTITFSGPNTYSGSFTNSGTFTNNPGSAIYLVYGTNLVISSGTFTIPPHVGLAVSPGSTLTINRDNAIKNFGKISNDGSLVNSGTLSLASGDTITFSGPNTYSGSFTNYGTFTNNPGSALSLDSGTKLVINSGTLTIPSGATLAVHQYSTLTVKSGNTLDNSGTLSLASGDTITFSGPNTYSGSFTNYGTFHNNFGSALSLVYGTKLVISSGTFTIPPHVGLYVYPSSSLTVNSGSTLVNSGIVNNFGTVTNKIGGSITNNPGSTSTNFRGGTFTNYGTITLNSGSTITNKPGGTFTNHGTIITKK